ncbi:MULTISPECIES: hypothetical protein [unclassified Synechococcus]|uniref:hypothetical protein n=1 Tax=unclassified Synechococcus TaxID=2626047 RepID=UPI001C2264EC|nr:MULTISPECIES: hypothetical protein [unclassified Synechococcus]
MEATSRSPFRQALACSLALLWIASELSVAAARALGAALRRLQESPGVWAASKAQDPGRQAASEPEDPQQEAVISGWEAAVAAGQWQEPEPIEPLCPGAWWDLIDPGERAEVDPEQPLRWAG